MWVQTVNRGIIEINSPNPLRNLWNSYLNYEICAKYYSGVFLHIKVLWSAWHGEAEIYGFHHKHENHVKYNVYFV